MTNSLKVAQSPEPWLRGTRVDIPAVPRAVLHALDLAGEDLERFCGGLSDEELNARPCGLPAVAFHIRHIARSVDRLLTYAEGKALDGAQMAALRSELEPGARGEDIFVELRGVLAKAGLRIVSLSWALEETRVVGKKQLPTTVAGLLIHVADHTQRHVGQAITTAKVISWRSGT